MLGEKQKLQAEDFRALAELTQHPGFALLCEVVQADIDDLSNSLATATTTEQETRKLNEWRALRSLYGILQSMPMWAEEQVLALSEAGQMADQSFLGQELTVKEARTISDQYAGEPQTIDDYSTEGQTLDSLLS